ncbi:HU family DNA-binding protein [Vibrio breoganii]
MKVTQTELYARVAGAADMSQDDVKKVMGALVDEVHGALAKGESLTVPGLVILEKGKRAARTGRNPKTGAPIEIAEADIVKIKQTKALKASVL